VNVIVFFSLSSVTSPASLRGELGMEIFEQMSASVRKVSDHGGNSGVDSGVGGTSSTGKKRSVGNFGARQAVGTACGSSAEAKAEKLLTPTISSCAASASVVSTPLSSVGHRRSTVGGASASMKRRRTNIED